MHSKIQSDLPQTTGVCSVILEKLFAVDRIPIIIV